jgi:hypothetical protein
VAQLYPRALGSLFVASYDSQGCVGGILTRRAYELGRYFALNVTTIRKGMFCSCIVVGRLCHSLYLRSTLILLGQIRCTFYWERPGKETRILTNPRSRTHLEKPPVAQLLENFPEFYGTRKFIIVFTLALHLSLS